MIDARGGVPPPSVGSPAGPSARVLTLPGFDGKGTGR